MSSYLSRPLAVALLFCCSAGPVHADVPEKNGSVSQVGHVAGDAARKRDIGIAMLLLDEGYPDAACKLLHETTPTDSRDPDRLYLLARCSAALGHIDAAIAYYQRVIALLPTAAKPRAELGSLYLVNGHAAEARQSFADAARLSPPGEGANLMRELTERLSVNDPANIAKLRKTKPWSIELYVGLTHDDNVNGGPVSNLVTTVFAPFTLLPEAMPRSSWGAVTSIAGSYVVPLSPRWAVLLQGSLAGTRYFSESDFNNENLALAAAFIYRDKDLSVSVQPSLRYSRQDDQLQEAAAGITGRLSKAVSPTWTATASAGYQDRTIKPDENRDAAGWQTSLGLINQATANLQLGAEYQMQWEDARQDVYSRTLHGPNVFAAYRVNPVFTLIGNYSYLDIDYDERMALFAASRDDTQKIASVTALWDISSWAGRNLVLRAQYMNIVNPSNIAYNDYRRNVFNLGAQMQF
jgi:tetratricopeptide (TPR) repeat protein